MGAVWTQLLTCLPGQRQEHEGGERTHSCGADDPEQSTHDDAEEGLHDCAFLQGRSVEIDDRALR